MNTCLDEGMLQAYLDGELGRAQMEACAAHLAACATCAELAHEAEHEYALFSTMLAPVLDAVPPTERLRANLEDAIADLQAPRFVPEPAPARLRAWLTAFIASFTITPRRAAAFASFLLAVALTVTLTMLRPKSTVITDSAKVEQSNQPNAVGTHPDDQTGLSSTNTGANNIVPDNADTLPAKPARSVRVKHIQRAVVPHADLVASNTPAPQTAPLLPEEKNYLTTIATLDAAIKAQGSKALPPTLRAEFERNLALVDQAIIATRIAARRNPKDTDAKDFLRTAYQNKVELLSTVADQTQFIAARD
jgi:hypothetical protein